MSNSFSLVILSTLFLFIIKCRKFAIGIVKKVTCLLCNFYKGNDKGVLSAENNLTIKVLDKQVRISYTLKVKIIEIQIIIGE